VSSASSLVCPSTFAVVRGFCPISKGADQLWTGWPSQYSVYVIRCASGEGQETWDIRRRFREFRDLRDRLIKGGATPLKTVSFPRKTVSKAKDKTDQKRVPVLQTWLNLVVSVYSGQPNLTRFISEFLEVGQPHAAVSVSGAAVAYGGDAEVSLERICGEWHARGLNQYRRNEIEYEKFVLEMRGGMVTGRSCAAAGDDQYALENVRLTLNDRTGLNLSFEQVYSDQTRTGWTSQVSQPRTRAQALHPLLVLCCLRLPDGLFCSAHCYRCKKVCAAHTGYVQVNATYTTLTNGEWKAMTGQYQGEVVGNFSAQRQV
jgi:hypothetical protein